MWEHEINRGMRQGRQQQNRDEKKRQLRTSYCLHLLVTLILASVLLSNHWWRLRKTTPKQHWQPSPAISSNQLSTPYPYPPPSALLKADYKMCLIIRCVITASHFTENISSVFNVTMRLIFPSLENSYFRFGTERWVNTDLNEASCF